MAQRTFSGHVAHALNSGLASAGLTMSKLPERNTLERTVKTILEKQSVEVVLDVGAHHGEFGQLLRGLGYRGRIVSIEPSTEAFARLREARGSDTLWESHPVCLGGEDGEVEIQTFRVTEFNSLHKPTDFATGNWFRSHMEPTGVQKVAMRRLDTLLPELGIDVRTSKVYLKIDTQGHDLQVIEGARAVLPHIDAMQTELSAIRLYKDTLWMGEALETFRTMGFLPTGFFAVKPDREDLPIIEWDCVLTRVDAQYLATD